MKNIRNLSLVLAGFVLGAAVTFTPQIQAAAGKLLGSKVGNVVNVKIDNKSIGQGAVISGTTYVPLRVTANEMGLEVVKVDSKEVLLSSGDEIPVNDIPETSQPVVDPAEKAKEEQEQLAKNEEIANLKKSIELQKSKVAETRAELTNLQSQANELKVKADQDKSEVGLARTQYGVISKVVQETSERLADQEQELTKLESQLSDLQK